MPSLRNMIETRTARKKKNDAKFIIQTGIEQHITIQDGVKTTTLRRYRRIVPNVNYQENQ